MSILSETISYFNPTEVKHYGKGRMGLSIRATARLLKLSDTAVGNALGIYAGANKINKKLSGSLDLMGFPLQTRQEWVSTGIPDIALGACISYYAHYAKNPDPEVIAISKYLTARSMREILQEEFGYKNEEIDTNAIIQLLQKQQADIEFLKTDYRIAKAEANEYNNLKQQTQENFPGLAKINNDVIATEQKSLPGIFKEFRAPDWLDVHAPDFDNRQRVNFCKDLAGLHRSLLENQPIKGHYGYIYNQSHEFLLFQVRDAVAQTIAPKYRRKTKTEKIAEAEAREAKQWIPVDPLTFEEQLLINQSLKVRELIIALGFPTSKNNVDLALRLAHAVKRARAAGKVPNTIGAQKAYTVTPELIQYIKNWFADLEQEIAS